MARLLTDGAEMQVANPAAAVGWTSSQGTVSINTTSQASGSACYSASCTAQNSLTKSVAGAVSTNYFARFRINPTAYPATNPAIITQFFNGATLVGEIRLLTSGKLSLTLNGVTIVTTAAAIPLNTWTLVEMQVSYPASGAATLFLRVNGVDIGNGAGSATLFVTWRVGGHCSGASLPTAGAVLLDDIALNDSTGANQNTWCGDGHVVMLLPVSDSSRVGWTNGTDGTTSLWDAVNNTPPVGLALASETATSQIRDVAVNATDTYVANMGAYTASLGSGGGGLVGNETIVLTQAICNGGQGATTNETLAVQSISNPAGTEGTGTTGTTAAGTFPTAWTSVFAPINYSPSVTTSTQPTVQVRKGTASATATFYDFMGLLVEYTPAVGRPTVIPSQAALLAAYR